MFTKENTANGRHKARGLTQRQAKFIEELPKNRFVVTNAMRKAGYSELVSTKRQDVVLESPSIIAVMERLGATDEELQREYQKIWRQDDDLTNKRLAIDKITDIKHPELKANNNAGTTNNIQIIGSDIAGKMLELQAELQRLNALETPIKADVITL